MIKKTGNNVVEYALILLLTALVIGGAISLFSPNTFKNLFRATFGNAQQNDATVEISPVTD